MKNMIISKKVFALILCIVLQCVFYFSGILAFAVGLLTGVTEEFIEINNKANYIYTMDQTVGVTSELPNTDDEEFLQYDEGGSFIGMVIEYDSDELVYFPEFPDTECWIGVSVYYSEGLYYSVDSTLVKWMSDDENVLWIDDDGMLRVAGVGMAHLTAEYTDDMDDEYYIVTQALSVTEGHIIALESEINEVVTFIGVNQYVSIYALSSNGNIFDVTHHEGINTAFSTPGIANFGYREVEPVAHGQTTLIASLFGLSMEIDIVVVNPVDLTLSASENSLTLYPETGYYIDIEATSGSYTVDVTEHVNWSISNADILEVDAGFIKGADLGNAIVTVTFGGQSLNIPVSVIPYPTMVNVTGSIASYNLNYDARFQLIQDNDVIDEIYIPEGDGYGRVEQDFTFENVYSGTYSLVIKKETHTEFVLNNIVVGEEDLDLTLDSRPNVRLMTLLCGDINGDGMINQLDLNILWLPANYNKSVDGDANELCDLNGDGVVNQLDLNILWLPANYNKGAVIIE